MNKKKIIVLTPRFPYPVIGGDRLRIYFLCKELAKHYDLTLLSLCESNEEMEMTVPSDGVFKQVERVLLPKWRSFLNCLLSLPTQTPLQVAYYRSGEFKNKLASLLPDHDGAFAHLVRTGDYLLNLDVTRVLEMTDAISMNYERVGSLAKATSLKTLVYSVEQQRLKKYEQRSASAFDASILVSQYDKDYLFAKGSPEYDKVLVCSNGVDLSNLEYRPCFTSKQIVFIGNLYSVQNVDAAFWFAKNVMPLLRQHGDYTFKVIGRIKDNDRLKFDDFKGVELTGPVDSVSDSAKGSLAGVCSVRLGAGVQNKILEYMALGLPTITSSTGLEGIEAIPDKEILVADEPSEYVEAILKLVNNERAHQQYAEAGLLYVKQSHSWESRLSPVISEFKKLVN
ncbi:glycosyltransferase family 4 protein [Motilimonas sp. 1_MG-2023]|uniref:glycosyltransferase family 4 protein n=1 Tax=Motilimonas sp. 1_MG-2023 TaxID=3062672 RepID=UPI0026E23435|nr:glycosyltransferase family 4 protein [Motilimonas sp. 1_MG-2023]MDO6527441.1 glycosyltransferase family 4 protein [Motilimonas sp. 1_MG-2023]